MKLRIYFRLWKLAFRDLMHVLKLYRKLKDLDTQQLFAFLQDWSPTVYGPGLIELDHPDWGATVTLALDHEASIDEFEGDAEWYCIWINADLHLAPLPPMRLSIRLRCTEQGIDEARKLTEQLWDN